MAQEKVLHVQLLGGFEMYYGDEAGLCGFTDPDNRRTYPWGREDQEMIRFHKMMIGLHKRYQVFRTGSIKILKVEECVLAYGRFDTQNQFVIVVNSSEELRQAHIPVQLAELPMEGKVERLVYSNSEGYTTESSTYLIEAGNIIIHMEPHSAAIFGNVSK